jgi:hypothetical protein
MTDPRRAVGESLLRHSSVTLFRRTTVLRATIEALREAGYYVVEVDARPWRTVADMHRGLARALDFPDYYGENLDAFNDCFGEFGFPPGATGNVVALIGYDGFAGLFPDQAHAVVDIIAGQSRSALLYGHHLICLVQADDPHFALPPVGATPAVWNPAEWHAPR